MKTVILLHGLHMHSFHFYFMKKELRKDKNLNVINFGYPSTFYNESILEKLNRLVEKIPRENEIVFVGHSMGGLVSRLYLSKFKPQRKIKLITLGTPHNGSVAASNIDKTCFRFFLGKSVKAGLVDPIPAWDNSYPLISIAGVANKGVLKLFAPKIKEDSDGTVFVYETIVPNATEHVILDKMHHFQFVFDKRAVQEIKKWL